MRISTSTIYETGGARISDLTFSLNRTQQQIAAQRRILTPEDDPIGAARALVITQSDAINDQFAVNRKSARNNLSVADGVLGEVTSTLHDVKALVVQAGNGALTDLERGNIADAIQGNIDRLFGLANSTDGVDSYLFPVLQPTYRLILRCLAEQNTMAIRGNGICRLILQDKWH